MATSEGYTDFDTQKYLLDFYGARSAEAPDMKSIFGVLSHFYRAFSYRWDTRSARLLEFSGGGVLGYCISAADKVGEIVYGVHVEKEREAVEAWLEGRQGAHDWSPYTAFVVNELEAEVQAEEMKAVSSRCEEREALMRSRIKRIVHCDILKEYPLACEMEPFDIVSANYCLECACDTPEGLKIGVKKLAGLLKVGGFLTTLIAERTTYCTVGDTRWPIAHFTMAEIVCAVEEAGLSVQLIQRQELVPVDLEISDCDTFFFIAALKEKDISL